MKELLTNWQKVILINYGKVESEKLAKILGTAVQNVEKNAQKMGLKKENNFNIWVKSGFVTIIRSNWDLLSNENIAYLLDISIEKFNSLLKEYDFLDEKLGKKPQIEDIVYSPLTKEQEENTKLVSKIIVSADYKDKVEPFDFYSNFIKPVYVSDKNCSIKNRFLASYSASYSGALLDDNLSDYSEEYLEKLASTGSNGIWLSDTLRNLANFPFDESLSKDYKIRIKNLDKLTRRCAKYGIDVYLYMNEPRSLPATFFDKYPNLRGQKADDGTYCLCTSKKEVQDYLYNAFFSIANSCPLLKGIMAITMSENPTNCYSKYWGNVEKVHTHCECCKNRTPQEVVSELNNIISRALHDGNGYTKLIANIWGWKRYALNGNKEVFETIDKLDKNIDILCVSEYGKEFTRGGVTSAVDDYSISVVGPSDFAKDILKYAKNNGHNIWAKVQINNSWECSAVPYIPAFNLMVEHIKALQDLSVDGLMLGWSLGGYIGGALPLINSLCENKNFDIENWYKKTYEENYKLVINAVSMFSKAFTNYPFSVSSIYFGGHNMGPANMWCIEKQNRSSTMVCFTFDDIEKYVEPYGIDKYLELLDNLCKEWENGLKLIENVEGNSSFNELKECAIASYIHFKSAYNLAKFSLLKVELDKNKNQLLDCLSSEMQLTKQLIKLISQNNKIGFEMTNHYYYNKNILFYKLVNLTCIILELKKGCE